MITITNKESISVVGAGLMGHGIAQIFAENGHTVWILDSNEDTLRTSYDRIRENLSYMANQGFKFGETIEKILNRIKISTDLATVCEHCNFVFEAVYENLELKQKVFTDLDRICKPEVILCSNTSVLSITEISKKAKHLERIIGTHFWNPPYLIPLVEVIRAEKTADWCVTSTYNLLKRAGKHPVYVHKDVPGFVGNRLQHALWREAFAIVDDGICDPATIDEVIRYGFGLRLPILGPIENADMVGLDLTLAIHNYILKYLNADPIPSKTLQAKVEAGELGFKSGSGFLEWTESSIAESRKRLLKYLINIFVKQKKK